MTHGNKRKAEQLGMPYGTACGRLRKLVLFQLLQRLGEAICFQCGEPISAVGDLSMEHKKPWLDSDPALFWDLDNIAFSHVRCNCGAHRRAQQGWAGRRSVNKTSGYKGVQHHTDKHRPQPWEAQGCLSGRAKSLGYFETAEAAARAYDAYVVANCGSTAVTNESMGLLTPEE